MTRSKNILLSCLLLFWIGIIYFFYSFFYQTSGKTPDWVYKTERPFFSGWSTTSPPLIHNNIIYYCAGYGWNKDVSLSAVKKDGTLVWKTLVHERCGSMNIIQDNIYVSQSFRGYDPVTKKITNLGKTIVVNTQDGNIVKNLPFQYGYISEKEIYSADDDYISMYNLNGEFIRKISISRPDFIWEPNLPNKSMSGLLRSGDGFWRVSTSNNMIIPVSDKGRQISGMQVSDEYFCYSSYDGRYDIRKRNTDIDGRMTCRHRDNWEKVFEISQNWIDCQSFYVNNTSLFLQKRPCRDDQGYKVINLKTKEEKIIRNSSREIPRLRLLYKSSMNFTAELTSPRNIRIKEKVSGEVLWEFKSTGWIHGLTEDADSLYINDDDGKLYAFKKKKIE